jgi:hypothetical protein
MATNRLIMRPGIRVATTDVLNTVVTAAPAGATIVLMPGTHRLATCTPKAGQRIYGMTGAVMNGSDLLESWTLDTGKYRHQVTLGTGNAGGDCRGGGTLCHGPEDVFMDDVKLTPVGSLGAVVSGTFYVDRAATRVWIADNPSGHVMEWSRITRAIVGTNANVVLGNLVVEKYAPGAQFGAIHGSGSGTGWRVDDCVTRYCHGIGIRMWTDWVVRTHYSHHNGQLGFGAQGDNGVWDGGEISYNNTSDYEPNWEAGANKNVQTTGFTVKNAWVHHNFGYGLWCDIDNYGALYDGNTVEDNEKLGILHEVSWDAIIRNNIVKRNGNVSPADPNVGGAGIAVSASPDVEIYNNVLTDNCSGIIFFQQNRGVGLTGPRAGDPHETENMYVHDNQSINTGVSAPAEVNSYAGGWQDVGDLTYFTSRNNRFENNTYTGNVSGGFKWLNSTLTFAQWQAALQDLTGSFT